MSPHRENITALSGRCLKLNLGKDLAMAVDQQTQGFCSPHINPQYGVLAHPN
jgi:hypothetical protein